MNEFYNQKITINKEENLKRLDYALAKLSNLTRSQIKILLEKGNIKKNQEIIKNASYKVKFGENYNIYLRIFTEEKFKAEDIPLNILFEDNDIMIINKISGMVTHPAPGNKNGTLVNALLNYSKNNLSNIDDNNRPGIVHRLDKETSGLMVVAKNNKSHFHLAEQFKDHSISRKYKAIVWGVPQNQIIEGYIQRDRNNRKKMALSHSEKGKYSNTKIKLLQTFQIASIVECILQTGRTHQVRVHMTSIQCPLIGDKVYKTNKISKFSQNKDTFNKYLILKNFSRHALHAYHLGFKHPKTNKYIEFNSSMPNDMQNLLDLIVRH